MTDEVVVQVKIDSKEAKKRLKEIKEESKKTGQEIESNASSALAKISMKWAVLGTLGYGVKKAFDWFNNGFAEAISNAQALDKTKFFMGLSTEKVQKLSSGLRIAGSSFDSFASSYGNMMSFLSSKTWGGWTQDKMRAFSELGISPSDYEDPRELLEDTAKALNEKPLMDRNRLAGVLGVSEDFLYALKEGALTFDKIKGISEETNEELKEMAKRSREIQEQWDDAQRRWGAKLTWLKEYGMRFGTFMTDMILGKAEPYLDEKTGGGGRNQVSKILEKEGFSKEAIAGILGNAQQESSFNPMASNGSHFGLFQWDRSRTAELKKFRPSDWDTIMGQTYFMIEELKRRGMYNRMKNMSSAVDATTYFEKGFEVSGGQDMAKRYRYAGVPEELIQGAVMSNYGRGARSVNQTNHITVGSVKEAGEFADYALARESDYAQITVMD